MTQKLTVEEFVFRAIEKLAPEGKQTIHTVFSGFNEAFREYFPGQDPIEEVKKLHEAGKISFGLRRGGAIIAPPGVIAPVQKSRETLAKMGV